MFYYLIQNKKLKLGLALNHIESNFEVWLLGQTKNVQENYWQLLKNSKWIKTPDMPNIQFSLFFW
ncbi:MAG TPA: hypothetical protein VIC08_03730 [Cellvibrionaceae bacterium]